MAADIRIARKNSGKVGLPEINLGVLAGTGGTARLTRLIGKAKALEMMVTGELMSFEDAKNHTLINQIWEGNATEFREMMLDWVSAQFTLPNKAAKAVGNIKRSCQTGPEIPSSTTSRSSVNSRRPSSSATTPRKASRLTSRSAFLPSPVRRRTQRFAAAAAGRRLYREVPTRATALDHPEAPNGALKSRHGGPPPWTPAMSWCPPTCPTNSSTPTSRITSTPPQARVR